MQQSIAAMVIVATTAKFKEQELQRDHGGQQRGRGQRRVFEQVRERGEAAVVAEQQARERGGGGGRHILGRR